MDGLMKQSARFGQPKTKQALAIWPEDEDVLWKSGVLGRRNPKQLVDTMFCLVGRNFALRSGEEHRALRFGSTSQIKLVEKDGERPYLLHTEEVSKSYQGGLKTWKLTPRTVKAFNNPQCPERCIVSLFKTYTNKRPDSNEFYLKPLRKPITLSAERVPRSSTMRAWTSS
ncbi:zinc finger MYM-type protein 2-like [Sycon ciliatum]|uniref:zinc finger MYM-type protein 2-like n=1 Tax=Sycon ciliatum TaxID=27933 RepID=UPI0031F61666